MAMADDVKPQHGRSKPNSTDINPSGPSHVHKLEHLGRNCNNHHHQQQQATNNIWNPTTTEKSPYTIPLTALLSSTGEDEPSVLIRQHKLRKKKKAHVCFPKLTPCAISRIVVRTDLTDKSYGSDKVYDAKLVTWDEYLEAKQQHKNRRRRDSLAVQRHARAGTVGVAQHQGKPIAVQKRTKKKKKPKSDNNNTSLSSAESRQRVSAISSTSSMNPTPITINSNSRGSSSESGSAGSGVCVTRWVAKPIVVSPLNDTNDANFAATAWPPIAMLGSEEDDEEEDEDGDDDDDDGGGESVRASEFVAGPYSEQSRGINTNESGSGDMPWGIEPGESLAQTAASRLSPTPSGADRRPSTHY